MLGTGGIKATKKKYPVLAWENTKVSDIMHQLANLEDKMHFYVNNNGKPVLAPIPAQEKGYVFNGSNVPDYEITYDSTNLITGVKIRVKDTKLLYSYLNSKLASTYGVLTEIISDSNISDKTAAKNKGQVLFKKRSKKTLYSKIRLLGILPDLVAGHLCVFNVVNSLNTLNTWWIDSVTTNISNKDYYQDLVLSDGKPDPPSNWIYTSPSEKNSNGANSENCTGKTVSNPQTIWGSCGECGNIPTQAARTVSFKDKCTHPSCKKPSTGLLFNPKKTQEGEWTCKACGADYCAKCGKEKIKGSKIRLEKVTACKPVKNVETQVSEKAQSLGSARAIFDWILKNIKYEFYYNNKYGLTSAGVMKRGKGNCYVQSKLFADMLNNIDIVASRQCGQKCGKYAHCNVLATINGQKYLLYTACRHQQGEI